MKLSSEPIIGFGIMALVIGLILYSLATFRVAGLLLVTSVIIYFIELLTHKSTLDEEGEVIEDTNLFKNKTRLAVYGIIIFILLGYIVL